MVFYDQVMAFVITTWCMYDIRVGAVDRAGGFDLYLLIDLLNIFKQGRTYRQNHFFTMLPYTV